MNEIDGNEISAAQATANFKIENTPYMREIVDLLAEGSARSITIMKGASMGLSLWPTPLTSVEKIDLAIKTIKALGAKRRLPRKLKKRVKKQMALERAIIERIIKRDHDLIREGYAKLERDYIEGKIITGGNSISWKTENITRINPADYPGGFTFGI